MVPIYPAYNKCKDAWHWQPDYDVYVSKKRNYGSNTDAVGALAEREGPCQASRGVVPYLVLDFDPLDFDPLFLATGFFAL